MKIRRGFVTNSSSSSFIVTFPKIPKSVHEMQEMLFGDKTHLHHPIKEGVSFSTEAIAAVVFVEMQRQIKEKVKLDWANDNLLQVFTSSEIHDLLWMFDENKPEEVLKKLKDPNTFYFHYSDRDSDLSLVMEQGDIFWRLEHRRISHR